MLSLTRRAVFASGAGCFASLAGGVRTGQAQTAALPFAEWVKNFRSRALARNVSGETYASVMGAIKPDLSVYALDRDQPEFNEQIWQYLNRRVSSWRIMTGIERARTFGPLLEKVERTYGVDRYIMLALWGMETAYGDVVVNPKHMRPVLPALAALAWGEPRRRPYWEQELLNALVLVEKGWVKPEEMIGSWAGAMGHTQWMPEVWLHMGVDFDGDGRISPYGAPDDALAGTARYLAGRGKYVAGEGWGYEVRSKGGTSDGVRSIASWNEQGVVRANGEPFPAPNMKARAWTPVSGGPTFLLTHNFDAIKSYNPANTYALAICHLADRIRGGGPFAQAFPGGERLPTLAEVQELQTRLTARGFDTGGTDGRVGKDTMVAIRAFQQKAGLQPADGYAGLKVLTRLRAPG